MRAASEASSGADRRAPVGRLALRTIAALIAGLLIIAVLVVRQDANYVSNDRAALSGHFTEYARYLDTIFGQVADHLEMLAAQGESYLFESRHGAVVDPPVSFSMVQEAEDGGSYDMREIRPPVDRSTIGHLTGIGRFEGRDAEFYREVQMSLHLNAGFHRAYQGLGNLAWIYYTSGKRHMNLYPWVATGDFHLSMVARKVYETGELEFYLRATPERNPERRVLWSAAYDDEAGKGVMTTGFKPVYDGDEFIGTVSADLLVDFLNEVVESFVPHRGGSMVLIDHEDNVLAYPDRVASGDFKVTTLADALPDELANRIDELQALSANEFHILGGWGVLTGELKHAPFRVFYLEPVPSRVSSFLDRVGASVVVLLVIMLVAVFFSVLVTSRRTTEVIETNTALSEEIRERTRLEEERERLHAELVATSRRAGMAEIASNVLHNIGNVLNSVTVAAGLIQQTLSGTRLGVLDQSLDLLRAHRDDLGAFFTTDPRGPKLLELLEQLAARLHEEHDQLAREGAALLTSIDHIRVVIRRQQRYAGQVDIREAIPLGDVVRDAVKLNVMSFERHQVKVEVADGEAPAVFPLDKHRVLQILVNLLSNAVHALDRVEREDKTIVITVRGSGDGHAEVEVKDNGVGLEAADLERIFEHGYTTRDEGHGFGLHDCGNLAQQMGGSLEARSDGPGTGAAFILRLPRDPAASTPEDAEPDDADVLDERSTGPGGVP